MKGKHSFSNYGHNVSFFISTSLTVLVIYSYPLPDGFPFLASKNIIEYVDFCLLNNRKIQISKHELHYGITRDEKTTE